MSNPGFRIINPAYLRRGIFAYFILLLGFACFIFPYGDSFYYWTWSQHLGLSYLDGPPMIAYMMHLSTLMFGKHFFAINFVSVACAMAAVYFIVKIGRLLSNEETAWIAALLWLIFPIVTQNTFARTTYDSPESLFWLMAVYYTACYTEDRRSLNLYAIGLSVGLALLSKYSGVVLILALCVYFAVTPSLRHVFKNKHFYLAALLALILFSPVLIWNGLHDWASFKFQIDQHTVTHKISVLEHFNNVLTFLWRLVYCLNVLFFIPVICWLAKRPSAYPSAVRRMLWVIALAFLGFWLVIAYGAYIKLNYYLPVTGLLALITADCLVRGNLHKTFWVLSVIFLLVSLVFLILGTRGLNVYVSNGYPGYQLEEQAISQYRQDASEPIVTVSWNMAPKLVFLTKKKYGGKVIIPNHKCDLGREGTFAYWDKPLRPGEVKHALYLNFFPRDYDLACVMHDFKTCTPLPTLTHKEVQPVTHKVITAHVYAYRCSN